MERRYFWLSGDRHDFSRSTGYQRFPGATFDIMWKFIFVLNLHLAFGSRPSDLIDGPRNIVVSVGERMEMKCQAGSNATIREWSFQRSFSSSQYSIFINSKDRRKIANSHFGIVDGVNGSGILYANATETDDAGIYTCSARKAGRQPDRYSALLTVLEKEPLCETNLSTSKKNIVEEGTGVWMRCIVYYAGCWTPTMEWRLREAKTNEEIEELTAWATVVTFPNANISSTLSILLNATNNSSYYSCKIYFTSIINIVETVTANNIPDYNYIWESPAVKVVPSTQWKDMTTDYSANEMSGMDLKTVSVVVLSILFGITISSVATVAIYTKRKKTLAALPIDSLDEDNRTEYHTITYDGYDVIEEVDIKDDVVEPHCCSAESTDNSLSRPNYYALRPVKTEVNEVYTDIDTYEQPMDKEPAIMAKTQSE